MYKGLRTGGKAEPHEFVRLFEEALVIFQEHMEHLNAGFRIPELDLAVPSVLWVDNSFLMARSLEYFKKMIA